MDNKVQIYYGEYNDNNCWADRRLIKISKKTYNWLGKHELIQVGKFINVHGYKSYYPALARDDVEADMMIFDEDHVKDYELFIQRMGYLIYTKVI